MTESTPGTTPSASSARDEEIVTESETPESTPTHTGTVSTSATDAARSGTADGNKRSATDLDSADADIHDAGVDDADPADDDLDALATPAEKATPISKVRRWLTIAIAVVFGLLFAYQVWGGVGSAITIPRRVSEAGGSVSALGWTMLILSIIVPLIAFYLSYRIGRRRGWISMILTYLVGVAASSAIALSLAAAFFLA